MPEGTAHSKYVRMSSKKVRRVLDMIRGSRVEDALNTLHFTAKAASIPVEKTIRSAIANVLNREGSSQVEVEDYIVKGAAANEGPVLKRFRPGPMGRGMRIQKRTCHISIVVGEAEN